VGAEGEPEVSVRLLRKAELAEARRIFQVAFGTFIGLPDPAAFAADRDYIGTRWRAAPEQFLASDFEGRLAGSNFVSRWGSFGFFGPLTVRPELWGKGIAKELMGATLEMFDAFGVRDTGLYTCASSAKHIGLYQKFGYWPRFLTAMMSLPVSGSGAAATKYSQVDGAEALKACGELTDSIYEGLDVSSDIRAVQEQGLGETLLVWDGDRLDAVAVCHCGAGTEAGSDNCYIKFAALRQGGRAFEQLIAGCEALAVERGLRRIETGVNLARMQIYALMRQRGFRPSSMGVAMHRNNSPAYSRADALVLDDWR
jgi:GNAT superfamily N-acetyltransferase